MFIKTLIRLQIGAQSATMGPPLGPTLGQFGVSAMDFIKRFNEESKNYIKGTILTTIINVYANRTFDIKILGPTFSYLLKEVYGCKKFNNSLKNFNNNKLLINNYIIFELFLFIKKYIKSGKNSEHLTEYNVKSIKGQIRSLGILYYYIIR